MRYFQKNCVYHIYNRGNRKLQICLDTEDYTQVIHLIKRFFPTQNFDILAYCIMPNHFHLLIVKIKNRSISYSMQMFGASYTRYFNKKYGLVGHLFQGTYKYKNITTERQLLSTSEYIYKNPLGLSTRRYRWVYINKRLIESYALILFQMNPTPIVY